MSAIISGMCSVARGICSGRSIRSVAMSSSKALMWRAVKDARSCPASLRELDDAVVDVRDVHHLAHAVAEVSQRAPQHVGRHEGAEVADVGAVVDRRPAGVEAHLGRGERLERLDGAAERVEQADRLRHVAFRMRAVRSSLQPAGPVHASTADVRAPSVAVALAPLCAAEGLPHPLVAELEAARVHRLGDAVRDRDQQVARLERQLTGLERHLVEQAEHGAAAAQPLLAPARAHHEGRHVARVHVDEAAPGRVELGVEQRHVAARLGARVHEAVEPLEHLRGGRAAGERSQPRVHRRHHQARRGALAGHVGDHQAEPVAGERDEVVVVPAHVKAGAALARDVEALRSAASPSAAGPAGCPRAISRSRSWRSFSMRRRCRRAPSSAACACRTSAAAKSRSSASGGREPGRAPTASRPASRPGASSGTTKAKSAAAIASRKAPAGSSATTRGCGSSRASDAGSPGRCPAASRVAPRARGRARGPRRSVVERRARREEVAHHGRDHQALDHVLVERRRQLAADVEQVLELVHPDRQVAVDAPQLFVDQPALDRRRRGRGEALEKRDVLGREGAPVAARPEPEESDRPARLSDRAQQDEPRVRERGLVRPGREGFLGVEARPQPLGHGPRQAARRPPLEARFAAAHVEHTRGDVELAHHEAEHRVRDLVAARRPDEAGREVVQRHELRQPRDERRLAPLAAQRLELLAAAAGRPGRVTGPPGLARPEPLHQAADVAARGASEA